jgi:hypothetical protein
MFSYNWLLLELVINVFFFVNIIIGKHLNTKQYKNNVIFVWNLDYWFQIILFVFTEKLHS